MERQRNRILACLFCQIKPGLNLHAQKMNKIMPKSNNFYLYNFTVFLFFALFLWLFFQGTSSVISICILLLLPLYHVLVKYLISDLPLKVKWATWMYTFGIFVLVGYWVFSRYLNEENSATFAQFIRVAFVKGYLPNLMTILLLLVIPYLSYFHALTNTARFLSAYLIIPITFSGLFYYLPFWKPGGYELRLFTSLIIYFIIGLVLNAAKPNGLLKAELKKVLNGEGRLQAQLLRYLEDSRFCSLILNLLALDRAYMLKICHLIWSQSSIRNSKLLFTFLDKLVRPKSYLTDLSDDVIRESIRPLARQGQKTETRIENLEYLHLLGKIQPYEYAGLLELYLAEPEKYQFELVYHMRFMLDSESAKDSSLEAGESVSAILYQIWANRQNFKEEERLLIEQKIPRPISWKPKIKQTALKFLREKLDAEKLPARKNYYLEGLSEFGDLGINERIELCKLMLNEKPLREKALLIHASFLFKHFQKILTGNEVYVDGLSSVLLRMDEVLKIEDFSNYATYIGIFLAVENPDGILSKHLDLVDLPAFHRSLKEGVPQEIVKKILEEEEVDINGSSVDVWLIKDAKVPDSSKVQQLILCGHSISPVCRRITAAIHLAKTSLNKPENRFTAGFSQLFNSAATKKGNGLESPFETLEQSLFELSNNTGLVNIYELNSTDYEAAKKNIQKVIRDISKMEYSSNKISINGMAIPVILPIYKVQKGRVVPLSFQVPSRLIRSKSFSEIMALYEAMSFGGMEQDLRRKINVIGIWKENRESERDQIEYNLKKGKYLKIPEGFGVLQLLFLRNLPENEQQKYGYKAKYMVSEDRVKLTRIKELSNSFVSWEDRIEQLKQGISKDQSYIDFYSKKLEEINRQKQNARYNFNVELIDIMLRKWDLGVLYDQLKNLYDEWIDEVRPLFWTFIQCSNPGLDLGLFSKMENIWFDVSENLEKEFYEIVPKIVIDANNVVFEKGEIIYGAAAIQMNTLKTLLKLNKRVQPSNSA